MCKFKFERVPNQPALHRRNPSASSSNSNTISKLLKKEKKRQALLRRVDIIKPRVLKPVDDETDTEVKVEEERPRIPNKHKRTASAASFSDADKEESLQYSRRCVPKYHLITVQC